MEVWEAAAVLGVGFVDADAPSSQGLPGVPPSDLDLIRARVAASQGQGPEPQPSATNPEVVTAMMNAFANR